MAIYRYFIQGVRGEDGSYMSLNDALLRALADIEEDRAYPSVIEVDGRRYQADEIRQMLANHWDASGGHS